MTQAGINYGPRPLDFRVVIGKPVVARFARRDPNYPDVIHGHLYRDRDGNERHDIVLHDPVEKEFELAFLRIVSPPEHVVLEERRKLILGRDHGGEMDAQFSFGARFLRERTRQIHGFTCILVEFDGPDVGELWWCEDLELTLEDSSKASVVDYWITEIERKDPPRGVFDLSKYKAVGGRIYDPSAG